MGTQAERERQEKCLNTLVPCTQRWGRALIPPHRTHDAAEHTTELCCVLARLSSLGNNWHPMYALLHAQRTLQVSRCVLYLPALTLYGRPILSNSSNRRPRLPDDCLMHESLPARRWSTHFAVRRLRQNAVFPLRAVDGVLGGGCGATARSGARRSELVIRGEWRMGIRHATLAKYFTPCAIRQEPKALRYARLEKRPPAR